MPDSEFSPLHAVRDLFDGYDRPWWIAGGWALDLYAARRRREHSDVDVLLLARDLDAFDRTFANVRTEISHGEDGPDTLVFPDHSGVRVVLAATDGDEWVYRRDNARIRRPLSELGRLGPDRLPYVAPEVVLLLSSLDEQPKGHPDFEELVDLLSPERRAWLVERLPLQHPWSAELEREQQVLLIGGRSGVGKTSVGYEVATQLEAAGIVHAHVEGDTLDEAYPKPHMNPRTSWLCEANLAAMWSNYAALGYRRMIYTNTAATMDAHWIPKAMGGAEVTGILLTASDRTAATRLAGREIGSAYDWHVHRSNVAARELEVAAPDWVSRVATDGRTVADIASEVIELTGWSGR